MTGNVRPLDRSLLMGDPKFWAMSLGINQYIGGNASPDVYHAPKGAVSYCDFEPE